MNDTTTDLRDAVRDVLSPHYGALTNSAIEDITAALLPLFDQHAAMQLRSLASKAKERADEWDQRAIQQTEVGGQAHKMMTISDKYRFLLDRLTTEADYLDGGKS